MRDSWTAPLEVQRVVPGEQAHEVAARQIRAVLRRQERSTVVPLFVFDAGYDPVPLTLALARERVAILVRMRSDRCFFGPPPHKAAVGRGLGPPCRHGATFDCKQLAAWPAPTAEHWEEDAQYWTSRSCARR